MCNSTAELILINTVKIIEYIPPSSSQIPDRLKVLLKALITMQTLSQTHLDIFLTQAYHLNHITN